MRAIRAALVAAVMAGLGLVAPTVDSLAASTTTAPPSRIDWHTCHNYKNEVYPSSRTRCAMLAVPLDYSKPHGDKIQLALDIQPHTSSAKNYKGVILVNFGGPGEYGLDANDLQDAVPHGVGHDYDWIGWDPRGVGDSEPTLSCDTSYFHPGRDAYSPATSSVEAYWKQRAKAYAQSCGAAQPALLHHMTTLDNARDMESIRKALGVKKISFYGYSYGTYLGQVYASRYGSHLNKLVLDSTVNPHRIWYAANLDQDKAFDANVDRFFAWVAKYHRHYRLGATEKTVRHRYYNELAALTRHPRHGFGPAEWVDAFTDVAYESNGWPDIADDWKSYALHSHTKYLISDYTSDDETGDDNAFAVYNATQCTDVQWPQHWSQWQRDNTKYAKRYPFFTWSNAWYNAACLYWPAAAHKPVHVTGKHLHSALMIDETDDAATPYSGSLEVRKLFHHARLIAEPGGTSHADSLDGDSCVDDHIAAYLKTGKLPKRRRGNHADETCKPLPPPTP